MEETNIRKTIDIHVVQAKDIGIVKRPSTVYWLRYRGNLEIVLYIPYVGPVRR